MTDTKWLTVSEASLLCTKLGLNRTTKTIRSWARSGHVEARKKSTTTGEMWILDKASLETKIQTEIEYRDQTEAVQTRANTSEPVQTGSDQSAPVQTGSNTRANAVSQIDSIQSTFEGSDRFEPSNQKHDRGFNPAREQELRNEIMRLKIDVGWRDKMIDKLEEENKTGKETLHGQARYIGHLESDLMRLGGKPDQSFLAAPKPQERAQADIAIQPEVVSENRPHPDQRSFYAGHTG